MRLRMDMKQPIGELSRNDHQVGAGVQHRILIDHKRFRQSQSARAGKLDSPSILESGHEVFLGANLDDTPGPTDGTQEDDEAAGEQTGSVSPSAPLMEGSKCSSHWNWNPGVARRVDEPLPPRRERSLLDPEARNNQRFRMSSHDPVPSRPGGCLSR